MLIIASVAAFAEESGNPVGNTRFAKSIDPALRQHCGKCHGGGDELEGNLDLLSLHTTADFQARPELLSDLIEALDGGYMPPEGAPALPEETRQRLIAEFRQLLHETLASDRRASRPTLRRMNRFQYNNAVQDLFQLKVEVFPLPERMMREHGNYFQPQTGRMPDEVTVGSRPLGKSQLIERRLAGVTPFPQDLRAEHGFDNRADHLSLSPLLLELFLRLGRSIVDSPDFSPKTCGIWDDFFAEPSAASDLDSLIRERLYRFLTRAFRRPIEELLLNRYAEHIHRQIARGATFTAAMKDAAAAALASPRFFYLYDRTGNSGSASDDFNLAARLSLFLWGSIPDDELLGLAAEGRLHEPDVLTQQVERMLRDEKLKRFCDSFPAQWLQLERIISSSPDREQFPQFYFAKYRASMHMMLEPLLLFETVVIEDRTIFDLLDPGFSYRSDLLQAWYRDGSQGNAGSPVTIRFHRVPVTDRRQGGVITNAAVMTMTSGTHRTKPITRGAWIAGVILNDPPEPPPADVPVLEEKPSADEEHLTLRERFAAHRDRPDCAACHQRIDPLGFALENYDAAGIWRDTYKNGRDVDASGTLFGKHEFMDVVEFKDALLIENGRFARALAEHLLAFALGREITVEDTLVVDDIVRQTAASEYRFHALIRAIVLSHAFRQPSAIAAPDRD